MSLPPPGTVAPLYSSDNPYVGVLGPSNFEPAPSESKLMQLYRLMGKCREYLTEDVLTKELAMSNTKEDEEFVFNWWVYDFEDNCMELDGISITDTLFVCRCLLMCCRDPDIRPMSSLYDIHELYVRLQVLGSNHTRSQFERPIEHREVEMLEKRIASLVVFVLSDGVEAVLAQLPGSLPLIDPKLKEQVEALKNVPYIKSVADPMDEEEKAKKVLDKKEAMAEKLRKENNSSLASEPLIVEEELSVNEGLFWHSDKKTVVSNFVQFASLILRNYHVEHELWKQFPERPVQMQHLYTESHAAHVKQWLRDKCEFDYADDFVKRFRDMVFDHWLPIGACQVRLRDAATKYDVSNPLNLLEEQLGVDSTTSLASYARERAMHISKDEKHQVYEFLLLSQFSYMMQHMYKTEFTRDYYISPTRIFKWRGRLKEKTTYMKPRRPILLRLKRSWLIHDQGEWITCSSLLDGLLKWMSLLEYKYQYTLATGMKLSALIDEMTKPKKIEEVY